MSLAASNYLIYIEKYLRQRFKIKHEISHLFCPWFKKEWLPACFTNRLNYLWRGFGLFTKLVLFEAKTNIKTGSGFKQVQNQYEKQMNCLPDWFKTKLIFSETNMPFEMRIKYVCLRFCKVKKILRYIHTLLYLILK